MKNCTRHILTAISLFLTLSLIFDVLADDDHYRKRHRYRGGSHSEVDDNDDHDRNDYLKPVTNQAYKELCGECHFSYQPELLPSASWLTIMNQLNNHFGEEVEAEPDTIKTVSDYLKANGAEASSADIPAKILKSLGRQAPVRITDIPYIRRKHRKLEPAVFKSKSVGSFANCPACHTGAEKGIYDDDDVRVPK